jgi:xylulokinase
MNCILGIDIGTYESKGVLVDESGAVVATGSSAHGLAIPSPGWAEQDAEAVWWRDFCFLAGKLLSSSGLEPSEVKAVGVSAIGPCVLPVDEKGRALRPAILYGIDTRASREISELTAALGAGWIRRTGGTDLSSQSAGPKILWLRKREPDTWSRTWKIMGSTTYLVFRLTGEVVLDHYTASFFQPLYNLHTRKWEQRACEQVCPEEMLPDLDWTASIAGYLTAEAAEETGLAGGTPVIVGTADAGSEAVSAGVVDSGDMMLMYGTTLFFIDVLPALRNSFTFWPAVFLFPDSFALTGGMSTTGAVTRWFRDQFAEKERTEEESGGANAYARLAEAAERMEPGSQGLLLLPYFSGERTPINDPLARGVLAGLTLAHSKAHVYRAILEGTAYGIRHNIEEMEKEGAAVRRLVAVGGGTKNRLWLQIVSDVLGREQIVQHTTGASYGDALLAATGIGWDGAASSPAVKDGTLSAGTAEGGNRRLISEWIEAGEKIFPDSQHFDLYSRYYALYRELYAESRSTVHRLAALGRDSAANELETDDSRKAADGY